MAKASGGPSLVATWRSASRSAKPTCSQHRLRQHAGQLTALVVRGLAQRAHLRVAANRADRRLIVIVARHMPLAESGSLPISLRAVL